MNFKINMRNYSTWTGIIFFIQVTKFKSIFVQYFTSYNNENTDILWSTMGDYTIINSLKSVNQNN
jgi:hypothetical protein